MPTSVPVGINSHTETGIITIAAYIAAYGFDCVAYAEFDSTHDRDCGDRDVTGLVTQSDCISALKREVSKYCKGKKFNITHEQENEALKHANTLHI